MKKILMLLLVFPVFQQGISQQKELKDLFGVWEVFGINENKATLQILDSSTIILTYNGERKKLTDHKIDFSKSPIWFDFSTQEDDSAVIVVKSIIEVVNKNLLKWQLFADEERTPYFSSSKGELFFLRKTSTPVVATAPVASN